MPNITYAVFISINARENNDTYVYLKEYETEVPDIARFKTNELYKSIFIDNNQYEAFSPYINRENEIGPFIDGRSQRKIPTRVIANIEESRVGSTDNVNFDMLSGNSSFPQDREEAINAYLYNNGMFIHN